jgi:hypothetical protein
MDRRTFFNYMVMSGLISLLATKGSSLSSEKEQEPNEQKNIDNLIKKEKIASSTTKLVNVSDYGSLVSGITNNRATIDANTQAIQTAINAVGRQGGGIVQIPEGKYQIAPPDLSDQKAASIVINYNNITLTGAGIGKTILYCRGDWSLIKKRVLRGIGILIAGTRPPEKPRQNITLQNFELVGGLPEFQGYTANRGFPAHTTTGDGWDITHKGICLDFDRSLDNITIDRVSVHDFRGELIYAGGGGVGNLKITNCQLFNSNGSLLSLDANLTVTNCDFGRTATAWIENAPVSPNKSYTFSGCKFHDSLDHGLVLAQGQIHLEGRKALITNCEFRNAGDGISIFGGINDCTAQNNKFFDCKIALFVNSGNRAIKFLENQINNQEKATFVTIIFGDVRDVLIKGNTFTASTTAGQSIAMYYSGNLSNIKVLNNTFQNCLTPQQTNKLYHERPLFEGNQYLNCTSQVNQGYFLIPNGQPLEPKCEVCQIVNNGSNSIELVNIATSYYADGQKIIVTGGSLNKQVKLPRRSDSIECSKERALNGSKGQKLTLQFDKAALKWKEVSYVEEN